MPVIMSTTQKQPLRVILAIAGLLTGAIVMLTSPTRADTIIFNDLTESPSLSHEGTDSTVTGQGACSIVPPEFCMITVTRVSGFLSVPPGIPLGPTEPMLNLAEDPQLQFLSDSITPTLGPELGLGDDTVLIEFDSLGEETERCADFESPSRPGQGCQFQENGQIQGFTLGWSNGDDFIGIKSDVEGVPEPASWLLFASGLLALLGFGSQRRRLAA